IIPSASSAITSALTEPDTSAVISFKRSWKDTPSFATRLGFVVTPAKTPNSCAARISSIFAVSTKNFIINTPPLFYDKRYVQKATKDEPLADFLNIHPCQYLLRFLLRTEFTHFADHCFFNCVTSCSHIFSRIILFLLFR